jgi:hypothetical protein
MKDKLIQAGFLAIALLHAIPAAGVLGASTLKRAYGVQLEGDLLVLMQHRAVLFALLSAGCVGALWQANWRWPMAIAALLSMLSFVCIAMLYPHGPAIRGVLWADVIGSIVMLSTVLLMRDQAWA